MLLDPRQRLYLEDPQLLEFDAAVVERRARPEGGFDVVLDRTAFYPTSGGQPHDTGTLNGVAVLDVVESEDGAVMHRLDGDPGPGPVHGIVDAERRRDHMQQHSGQHLLSATCLALLGRETLSFHLGTERCSIDLPGEPLAPEALEEVERRANRIVWEGRAVRARLVPASALQDLRKPPPPGVLEVRVVEIEGWDANACCGTHVRRTSEIGMVKLFGQERAGRGVRLHFACGARALAECARMQRRVDELVRLLTCHPDALGEKCARLLSEVRALRKEGEQAAAELAAARAASWVEQAPRAAGVPIVAREIDARGSAALRPAAEALVERGAVALLATRGERADLLFMRPEAVEADLRDAMRAACETAGGRGGGQASRAQGSVPRLEDVPRALAAARDVVVRQLGADPAAF